MSADKAIFAFWTRSANGSYILPHLGVGEIEARPSDLKLSMTIDKVYSIELIMPRHWERCAASAKVGREFTAQTIRHQLAVRAQAHFPAAAVTDRHEHPEAIALRRDAKPQAITVAVPAGFGRLHTGICELVPRHSFLMPFLTRLVFSSVNKGESEDGKCAILLNN